MLTKPLSHLRPLLRLPSHTHTTHTQPDHFTSNPSLPHHLPRQGGRGQNAAGRSHALVQPGAAHTAGHGPGGAKGAGQGRGYGRESGTGSGYTGHARAFLSLPQGSHVDPNAGLATDETRDELSIPSTLSRPSYRASPPKATSPDLSLSESPFHDVRYRQTAAEMEQAAMEEEKRFGGVSELAGEWARARDTGRQATTEAEDVDMTEVERKRIPRRRSSISIAQLQSGSSTRAPSPMVGSPRMRTASPLPAFLPGHGPALSRTGSFMDVGLLGTIPGRPVVARAMSSATISRVQSPSPSSLLEETERAATPIPTLQSASSTRLVPQANRILMDLAGRDLPAPRSLGRRYNSTSTAAYRNNRSWADDVILSSPSSRPLSPQEMDDQARDKKIYAAIVGAVEHHQPALFHSLVQHYRSSRVLAPYDSRTVPGEEGMSHKFPLPSNWTANTYNAILTGLNYFRADGESVAPSLEIYNEMLERDVLPNGRTYAGVIQALSMRERDVWAAVQRWELERDWLSWREEKIGVPVVEGMADERKDLIQGYIAEGNMISALRLFRAAVTFHNTSGWKFMPETYFAVLDALSAQRNPDFAAVDHVFQHAYSRSVSGWRALSRYVFTAHAKRDDRKHLLGAWESFEGHIADIESGKAEIKLRDWLPRIEADTLPNEMRLARARGQMRGAYEAAIEAFVAVGDLEKAAAIFERATKSEMLQQTTDAGEARVSSELYSTYLAALAKHGHGAKAAEEYERLKLEIDHSLLGRLPLTGIVGLVDALVPAGQWRFAQTLLMSVAQVQIDPSSDGSKRYWIKSRSAIARLRKVYVGILAEAAAAPSAEEARKVMDLAQALADSDTTVSWPVSRFAFDLLDKHAFWDLGEAHAKMIEPFESDIPALVSTIHAFSAKASKELPLRQAIDVCVALAKPCGRLRLRDRASIFLERYGIERAALSDAHGGQQLSASDLMSFLHSRGWVYLLDLVSLRPYLLELPAFKEGEYDATLEQLVSDIETLQVAGRGKVINSQVSLVRMADALLVLRERFGATRMGQMAKRMFGEQADEFIDKADETWQKLYLRNFQMPAAVGQEDMGMGSPVQSVDSASQSGLASEDGQPSSATSFAPSSGTEPAAPKLHLDAGLTRDIDALLKTMVGNSSRQGQIALQAYNVLVNAYETGKVPAIASIARTISNLRRPGDEAPISHLYSIAQSALGSYVGSAISRATAWRTVEDSMIVACCHLGRLEQAGAHRARIIEAGMTPSADAYATMIASSKDTTDDALVAREMFDESQRLGVKPHLYLYNTIISKLSKARKVELALELFAHMKAAGVVPSSVTYGAVMNACTRVGDAQSAENLFEEMRMQRNFKPRVPPYNTMIQLFVQTTPNREKALHYYGLLRAAGVPPSAHTYKLLLDLHATLAPFDLAAAERVFRDIESDPSVSVQGSHFASLITGYGIYADNLDKALSVFESISARLDSETILSEAVVWEAVLNVIAHRGTLEQLQEMRQRMESTSTARPTAYVYNVLITGYARGGEIDTARALFESMGDSIAGVAAPNNHPVLHTSSGLPKPSTRTPAAVQQVGEGERVEVGVVFREPSTYEAMLRAELSVGDVERAQEVMRRMEQRGYPWAVVARVRAVLDEAAMAQIAQTAESSAPTSTA